MKGQGTYHNGISVQSTHCLLQLSDEFLHIYPEGETTNLFIWNVKKLQHCERHGEFLTITYGKQPYQRVQCTGELAQQVYDIWSGNIHIVPQPDYLWRGVAARFAFLAILILVIMVLSLFYILPWLGEKAVNLIPVETEVQIGERLSEVYTQESELNDSASYYLKEFVKQLEVDDTYKIDVKVINSEEINAFALPGGKIFVYSSLIKKMTSYEELVALLGHEITHVVNRHSLKSIGSGLASTVIISSLFGNAGGLSAGILAKAHEFKQLNYSRELETEADESAIQIMLQNNVNPVGMLNLLKLLKAENAETPRYMKYLSTHPDTDTRLQNINSKMDVSTQIKDRTDLMLIFNHLTSHL